MAYTLKQLVEDCRAALTKDKGAIGRNAVRKFVELACLDDDFVSTYHDCPRAVIFKVSTVYLLRNSGQSAASTSVT